MKNRLILLSLLLLLWVFLLLLKVYFVSFPSTVLILAFIAIYCAILSFSQFFIGLKTSKFRQNEEVRDFNPHVNIFIPAHNEALVLKNTVENLLKLDYSSYDILIINDRSKDNTEQIAKEMVENYPEKVKLYSRSQDSFPGKAAVLNDALSITTGEVICVFDADAKVNPDFLTRVLPYLNDNSVAAVQTRKVISNKDYNFLTRVQNYEYSLDTFLQMGKDSLKGAVELRGNGEIIKREALVKVDAWNENTLTDDLDISTKFLLNNYNIRFCDTVVVNEEGITNVRSIINQRKRWAEGSIRRYLDYSGEIFTSKNVNTRVILDMIAYFSEFVLPVWLISELAIQVFFIAFGYTPEILLNLLTMFLINLFFMTLFFIGIRKYDGYGLFKSLIWSFLTSVYIILLWTLVVFIVVLKIIFKQRDLSWYKTSHAGNVECVNQEVNERS